MGDAIENEIYQELYAIRSLLQSMDFRSELISIRQELQRINNSLDKISRGGDGSSSGPEEPVEKPKSRFGFLR